MKNLRAEKLRKDTCSSFKFTVEKNVKGEKVGSIITRPLLSKIQFLMYVVYFDFLKLGFVSVITDMICHCYNNLCFMQCILLIFKVLIYNSNAIEIWISFIIFNINVFDT